MGAILDANPRRGNVAGDRAICLDIDAVARAISNALAMPGEERRQRWEAMMQTLKSSSLDLWFSEFVSALAAAPRMPKVGVAPDVVAEPPRRRRAELTAIQNY